VPEVLGENGQELETRSDERGRGMNWIMALGNRAPGPKNALHPPDCRVSEIYCRQKNVKGEMEQSSVNGNICRIEQLSERGLVVLNRRSSGEQEKGRRGEAQKRRVSCHNC
jgi:hypothetical protein